MHETLQQLVGSLGEEGEKRALFALDRRSSQGWSYRELASRSRAFASGLAKAGFKAGDNVALFAENRPEWIAAALGVIRAGAVVVPLDVQFGDDDLAHILADSEARAVITTERRRARVREIDPERRLILLDAAHNDERSWEQLCLAEPAELPVVSAKDPAVLFYTSGTTGPPKGVPLSHANIASQLEAVRHLQIVTRTDRVLLPLPLHHVYPFVIGMLAPLSLGLPLILPFSLTGQQLLRALREGDVTTIVGVPRLYGAIYAGIRSKVESSGRVARRLFQIFLWISNFLRESLGIQAGRILFRSLHQHFGKNLRLLASGGSALDPELTANLQSLGWQIAIGYGLTETSPLLSINLPDDWRSGSAGKAFPGVDLRIDPQALEAEEQSDQDEIGEVLARGPNVFSGYRNLPEQTAHAFTSDGWFRTGDIGHFEDGFLYLAGRLSTLIKTESGEKVQTEEVESAYAKEPAIREIGVLEKQGKLVALIDPRAFAGLQHFAQQIAHGIDPRDRLFAHFHSACLCDLKGKVEPLERINRQIKLQTCVRREPFSRVTSNEQFPNRLRPGLLEKGAIFSRHLFERHHTGGRGFSPAAFRDLESLPQTVTLKFPQTRTRQRIIR